MRLKRGSYVLIPELGRSVCGLKGNELFIFSIIYGFSQDGRSWFTGSAGYISAWTGLSKASIYAHLKKLCAKGIIEKRERVVSNVTFCDYRAIIPNVENLSTDVENHVENLDTHTRILRGVDKNLEGGRQESCAHNLEDNLEDNLKIMAGKPAAPSPRKPRKPQPTEEVREVVAYLNERTGASFRDTTAETVRLIGARLKEGYSVQDLESIVDVKAAEWMGDERMAQYLCPKTLFNASNAEKYLQQANRAAQAKVERKRPTEADRESQGQALKKALEAAREFACSHDLPARSICENFLPGKVAVLTDDGNTVIKVFS